MTALLAQLEQQNPHVRAVMANALRNVRPTHLLDRDVARAWAERAATTSRPRGRRPRRASSTPARRAGVLRRQAARVESIRDGRPRASDGTNACRAMSSPG